MLFRGAGVFSEQLPATRAAYSGEALIDEVLAFIDARQFRGPGKRGLIRANVAEEDDAAA